MIALLLAYEIVFLVSPLASYRLIMYFQKMLPVADRLGIKGVTLISTLLVAGLTVANLVLVFLDMALCLCREMADVLVDNIPEHFLKSHPFISEIISRRRATGALYIHQAQCGSVSAV